MKEEEAVRADLKAADVALLSNSEFLMKHLNCMMPCQKQLLYKQSVNVATMMLDTKTNWTMQCKTWRK